MKRILFIAAALLAFTAFTGCEGPEGPMGPQGQNGYNGQDGKDGKDGKDGHDGDGLGWHNAAITVRASDWQLKGEPGDLNSYFFAYKSLSQLDEYVYEKGSVIVYLEVEEGVKNGMPYVLHKGEEVDGKEFIWTQTYDFDFDIGGVGFYVTYSDFSTNIKPETETFHVVLMW